MIDKRASLRRIVFGIVFALGWGALGTPCSAIAVENKVTKPPFQLSELSFRRQAKSAEPALSATAEDEESPYGLWVGETKVADGALSGKGWSFDKDSYTLRLEDYESDEGALPMWHENAALYYAGTHELTIEVSGYCTLRGPFAEDSDEYGAEVEDGYGILNEGAAITVAVKVGGSLEIASGKDVVEGGLRIDEGLYVEAGSALAEFRGVEGFHPTTEVKSYEEQASRYLYIAPKPLHWVTVADSVNGYVSAVPDIAVEGETVEIKLVPKFDYELDEVTVAASDSSQVEVTSADADTFSFVMPDSDVTVSATFKRKQYNVIVNPTTNGTVTVNKTKALSGEKVTLNITPAEGYVAGDPTFSAFDGEVEDVPIIDGSFDMPTSDVIITVPFVAKTPDKDSSTSSNSGTGTTTTTTSNSGTGTTTTSNSGTGTTTTSNSGTGTTTTSNSGTTKTTTTSSSSTPNTSDQTLFAPIVLIACAGVISATIGLLRREA